MPVLKKPPSPEPSPREPLPRASTGAAIGRLKRAVGQLLTVGFDGPSLPHDLSRRIAASEVGGVMLFRPNIETPAQVASVVAAIRTAASTGGLPSPCLVAVDQEGGLVQRLRAPLTVWPDMLSVGAAGDPARTTRVGQALGSELAALGIGWDFAPVLDVHTNPDNPVIGNRAFGRTPDAVVAHALAFWRGLRSAGVLGCGKHFPGHGDTRTDSHVDLPVVEHPVERLRRIELAPFAAAARAGIDAIMTAHVSFPALDPDWPATLSRRILTGLLREEMGYSGVIVSDDLGMKAVADRYSIEDLAVGAIAAGADILLVREPVDRQVRAFEALLRAAEADDHLRDQIERSGRRVAAMKAVCSVAAPASSAMLPSLLGTPGHRALAATFPAVDARSPVAASAVADT
jgi:beta-N-acetylhexosaminidase